MMTMLPYRYILLAKSETTDSTSVLSIKFVALSESANSNTATCDDPVPYLNEISSLPPM